MTIIFSSQPHCAAYLPSADQLFVTSAEVKFNQDEEYIHLTFSDLEKHCTELYCLHCHSQVFPRLTGFEPGIGGKR